MMAWEMTPEEIKLKIANMLWSFSRVNSFSCAYRFYLTYVEEQQGLENANSQYGKFLHKILEMILKRELDVLDAPQYYTDHYEEWVTCEFPPNPYVDLGEKAYAAGLDYLNNFNFDFDRYEILGVEKEYQFKVGDYPFQGFVDAIYRDKETNEIIIRDHKTSSFKYLKNGNVASSSRPHFEEFKKQLYLYAIPVIEEFGKVDKLSWNMIRDQRDITIPFDENEFEEAKKWAIDSIESLKEEELWLPDTSKSYFCNCICGMRGICIYRQ